LEAAGRAIASGEPVARALAKAKQALVDAGFLKIDYVALVDAVSLEPLETPRNPMRLIAAATIGETRLIDNIPVKAKEFSTR
jgi:pantoate--beta-alanine ligase